jgi:hypothetical protein
MNRRTAFVLTAMALLGLAAAGLPQLGFAQSSPLIGTWKLSLDKSKFSPGPPPRSASLTYTQDGKNIRATNPFIDAQGNPVTLVNMLIFDGQPHPSIGSPNYDATAYTRLDANTIIYTRLKAGKLVGIGTNVMSQDGKTLTISLTGTDASGRASTNVFVYDKQ